MPISESKPPLAASSPEEATLRTLFAVLLAYACVTPTCDGTTKSKKPHRPTRAYFATAAWTEPDVIGWVPEAGSVLIECSRIVRISCRMQPASGDPVPEWGIAAITCGSRTDPGERTSDIEVYYGHQGRYRYSVRRGDSA